MSSRIELHNLLLSIGGSNVYYQVPSNLTMKYPAIKYSINNIENDHANNSVYNQNTQYTIIVMSRDPDDEIVNKISRLPKCKFDRRYTQDNIHHTSFTLYY